jgi:hypothetical protein
MEYIILAVLAIVFMNSWYNPNSNSTSYRLGRGVGNKTRKFGEWLMRDD